MQSQNQQIREYLEAGHTLTAIEALSLFNCLRLSARIDNLKNDGLPIAKQTIKTSNGKHVAQYSLN